VIQAPLRPSGRFPAPDNRLARKLEAFTRLSARDKTALDRVWKCQRQICTAQRDLICEGDVPHRVPMIVDGWACRYKALLDGRRQITGFFLPGDICDFNVFILKRMDHSIRALTAVTYVALSPPDVEELTSAHPRIMHGLWRESLVNASIQREWTVNLGQRSALERLAHLLCELFIRLRIVGMTRECSCEFPVTQSELADTLGLTAVHVSRTIKSLRARGLIRLQDRKLEILDFDALRRIALFDSNYLHLDRDSSGSDG